MITPNETQPSYADKTNPTIMPAMRHASMNKKRLGCRRALLPSVEWRDQAPLCEHDAKAQARLAAELLRFDEVLDEDSSIRFDDAL